jgi:hypothetical protein
MEFVGLDISCNFFQDAIINIKNAELRIELTRNFKERQYFAQDILLKAEDLLSCQNHNSENPDCSVCHSISRKYMLRYKNLVKESPLPKGRYCV